MDDSDTGVSALDRAFHEAGHAVGAVLRGHAWDARIEEMPEAQPSPEAGCELHDVPAQVRAFVAYAGVWAVARHRWMGQGARTEDARGRTFEDYIGDALLAFSADAMTVAMSEFETAALLRHGGADDEACWRWMRGVHYAWRGELEDVWDVVAAVAAHLGDGGAASGHDIVRLTDARLADLYS